VTSCNRAQADQSKSSKESEFHQFLRENGGLGSTTDPKAGSFPTRDARTATPGEIWALQVKPKRSDSTQRTPTRQCDGKYKNGKQNTRGREASSVPSPWRRAAAAGARGRRASAGACCSSAAAAGPGPAASRRAAPTPTARTPRRPAAAQARTRPPRPAPPRRWPQPWRSPSRLRYWRGRGRRWRTAASPAAALTGTPRGRGWRCMRGASPSGLAGPIAREQEKEGKKILASAAAIQESGVGRRRKKKKGEQQLGARQKWQQKHTKIYTSCSTAVLADRSSQFREFVDGSC
jgi:hypothetical protein